MLFGYDKEHLITLPTPIQPLPAISAMTGCDFYIKRDDMTDLGMGGNKLRKLEYLLWDAKRQGATTLLTYGGAQTNHGRLTAAVAAKYGMKCAILCLDEHPEGIDEMCIRDSPTAAPPSPSTASTLLKICCRTGRRGGSFRPSACASSPGSWIDVYKRQLQRR